LRGVLAGAGWPIRSGVAGGPRQRPGCPPTPPSSAPCFLGPATRVLAGCGRRKCQKGLGDYRGGCASGQIPGPGGQGLQHRCGVLPQDLRPGEGRHHVAVVTPNTARAPVQRSRDRLQRRVCVRGARRPSRHAPSAVGAPLSCPRRPWPKTSGQDAHLRPLASAEWMSQPR
jgi:hypothetical protein